MGKPEAPTPLDPSKLIKQQTNANKDTASYNFGLNAVDQINPYGAVDYTRVKGKNGQPDSWTQTTTLNPGEQAVFDANQGARQGVANEARDAAGRLSLDPLSTPSYSSYAGGPTLTKDIGGADDYSADRSRVEDALFARLNPQLDRDRSSLENRLTQQGIRIGSDAWDRAMGDFGKDVNDARIATILNAGTEQNRMQQLELNAGNFQNTARQQEFENSNTTTGLNNANRSADFANKVTKNGQSINEIMSLLNGSQINVPSAGAQPSAGVAGVDTAGIASNSYNQAYNNYNQQMQQWNGTLGGLFGLGSNALLAWSDERLKTDKKRIGTTPGGLGIFSYRYKGSPDEQVGVMAQEVEVKQPHAVHMQPNGFRAVDYGAIS